MIKRRKKEAKDWNRTVREETAWFSDSVGYAKEMHDKALARRQENSSLLAVDESVAPVADPETIAVSASPAANAAQDRCREPGALHAGDTIVIVRMKREVPVRVLLVSEAAVELAGSLSLIEHESVKHCGEWVDWQALRRVPGAVESTGAERVFEDFGQRMQDKLVEFMADAASASASAEEAPSTPIKAPPPSMEAPSASMEAPVQ